MRLGIDVNSDQTLNPATDKLGMSDAGTFGVSGGTICRSETVSGAITGVRGWFPERRRHTGQSAKQSPLRSKPLCPVKGPNRGSGRARKTPPERVYYG